jgi:hypothetical protein
VKVANVDVAALERGLAAVLQGDVCFDDPLHLSPNNYKQLIRLCQLGVDYLEHEVAWRRNMVVTVQEKLNCLHRCLHYTRFHRQVEPRVEFHPSVKKDYDK